MALEPELLGESVVVRVVMQDADSGLRGRCGFDQIRERDRAMEQWVALRQSAKGRLRCRENMGE